MALISPGDTAGRALIIVEAIVAFLAFVVVCLRLWGRRLKGTWLHLSDWLCVGALILALALIGTVFDLIEGFELPLENATPKQLAKFYRSSLAGLILWTTSIALIRISILILYMRVFPLPKFVTICRIFIAVELLYDIATYTIGFRICKPIGSIWGPSVQGRQCGDRRITFLWHGIHNIVYEVSLVTLPMPLVWRLQLPVYKRVSLIGIFGLGYAICAITLCRVLWTSVSNIDSSPGGYFKVTFLTMLEPSLGVINCSLPLLRPAIRQILTWVGIKGAFGSDDDDGRTHLYPATIGRREVTRAANPYSLGMDTVATLGASSQIELHTTIRSNTPACESTVSTTKQESV